MVARLSFRLWRCPDLCHRRVDPFLQNPAAPSGAGLENSRYSVCFSSLTCAETGGSLDESEICLHQSRQQRHCTG
jgi:hypothetical protein